jgi:hypothetical protein
MSAASFIFFNSRWSCIIICLSFISVFITFQFLYFGHWCCSWQYGQFNCDQPRVRVGQLGERGFRQVDAVIQPLGWPAIIYSDNHKAWPKLDAHTRVEWHIPHGARHGAWVKPFAVRCTVPSTLVAIPGSGNGDGRGWRLRIRARDNPCEYAHAGYYDE